MKLILLGVPIFISMLCLACSTPEKQAQRLFDNGQYEEVLSQFPDKPIAVLARQKLAERMLGEGKYEDVIRLYPDTPSASQAAERIADSLLAMQNYEVLLQRYPNTKAATFARELEANARAALDAAKSFKVYGEYPPPHLSHLTPDSPLPNPIPEWVRDKAIGKRNMLRDVADTYPGTTAAAEASKLAANLTFQIGRNQRMTLPSIRW